MRRECPELKTNTGYMALAACALASVLLCSPTVCSPSRGSRSDVGKILDILIQNLPNNDPGTEKPHGGYTQTAPLPAGANVVFDDKFTSDPKPEWSYSDDPWMVIDGYFMPIDLPAGKKSSATVKLSALKECTIDIDFFVPAGCGDSWSVKVSGRQPGVAATFLVNLRGYCAAWIKTDSGNVKRSPVGKKGFNVMKRTLQSLRIELQDGKAHASFGKSEWEIPFEGSGGPLCLTVDGYGEYHNDTGVRFKRVRVAGMSPGPGLIIEPLPPGKDRSAIFVLDPRDLDTLVVNLRKKVDNEPKAKTMVDNGKIALARFDLVNVPSESVARDVAEDMATALINNGFELVERGQLDKIFNELKIQDSGAINPATAKKLGEITGCDLILVGSISDRGNFVVINTRLLSTQTGQAVVAEKQEMRKIKREE